MVGELNESHNGILMKSRSGKEAKSFRNGAQKKPRQSSIHSKSVGFEQAEIPRGYQVTLTSIGADEMSDVRDDIMEIRDYL